MKKILLVEDNHINQMVASQMMEKLGHNVSCANDGAQALDKLEKEEFDLIFMDCQMPVMDGYQAAGKIKERRQEGSMKDTPVIAFTAHAMQGDKQKCIDAGMDGYISKPVDEDQLKSVIAQWTGAGQGGEASSDDEQEQASKNLNHDTLQGLKGLMGDGFSGLIDAFKQNVEKLIQEMGDAVNQNDFERLSQLAHTVKSPSAQLGAENLYEAALDLEKNAKESPIEKNAEAVLKIQELYQACSKELSAI